MIYLTKDEIIRRILPDGKLQNWDSEIGCWRGMKRVGDQFKQTAEEVAAGFETAGWKRISETEATTKIFGGLPKLKVKR